MWHPRPANTMLLGTTTFGRRVHMLTSSTGLILAIMRSLGVSLPSAAIEPSKKARNLGLLMGSHFISLSYLPVSWFLFTGRSPGIVFGVVTGIPKIGIQKILSQTLGTGWGCRRNRLSYHRCGISGFDEFISRCHCGIRRASECV